MPALPGPADVLTAVGNVVGAVAGAAPVAAADPAEGLTNQMVLDLAGDLAASGQPPIVALGRFKGALLALKDPRWQAWITGVLNGTITE